MILQIFKDARQGVRDIQNIFAPIAKTIKLGFNANGIGRLTKEEEDEIIEMLMLEEIIKRGSSTPSIAHADTVEPLVIKPIGMNPKQLLSKYKRNETLRHVLKLRKNSLEYILGYAGDKLIIQDLEDEPHLFIGGKTKSGKTVTMFNILVGLVYINTPHTLQISLIDAKLLTFGDGRLEKSAFLKEFPAIGDSKRALKIMQDAHAGMMKRYDVMLKNNIKDFRKANFPAHVIFVDEVSFLLQGADSKTRAELLKLITGISAMGRQAGVHLVLGTQSIRASLFGGELLANVSKIGHLVSSSTEAGLLELAGANNLKGKGDGLKKLTGENKVTHFQATYIDIEEDETYSFFRSQTTTKKIAQNGGKTDPNHPNHAIPKPPNPPRKIGVLTTQTTQTTKTTQTTVKIGGGLTLKQRIIESGKSNAEGKISPKKQLIDIGSRQQRSLYELIIKEMVEDGTIELRKGKGYFLIGGER